MIDLVLGLAIVGIIVGPVSSLFIARHFNKKDRASKNKRPSRRRTVGDDQFSIKLDLTKPDLGLTDEKIKKIGFAWLLNKLIDGNNNKRDAI